MDSLNEETNNQTENIFSKKIILISLLMKILKVIVVIIVVILITIYTVKNFMPARNSKASSSDPSLSLIPRSVQTEVGKTFRVQIILDTKEQAVSAVKLHLVYASGYVEITRFNNGSVLPIILEPASFGDGEITTILGAQPEASFHGSGIIAGFDVKIIGLKKSSIKFADDTQVAVIGKNSNSLDTTTGIGVIGFGTSIIPTNSDQNQPTQRIIQRLKIQN